MPDPGHFSNPCGVVPGWSVSDGFGERGVTDSGAGRWGMADAPRRLAGAETAAMLFRVQLIITLIRRHQTGLFRRKIVIYVIAHFAFQRRHDGEPGARFRRSHGWCRGGPVEPAPLTAVPIISILFKVTADRIVVDPTIDD